MAEMGLAAAELLHHAVHQSMSRIVAFTGFSIQGRARPRVSHESQKIKKFCLPLLENPVLTREVVRLPRLLARRLVERIFGTVLVPQVEVAEDGVGAVDLTRGARQVEVIGEDVAERGLNLRWLSQLA